MKRAIITAECNSVRKFWSPLNITGEKHEVLRIKALPHHELHFMQVVEDDVINVTLLSAFLLFFFSVFRHKIIMIYSL